MRTYFNCHSHTMYSNLRLLDCINQPKDLINKAIELNLSGIAITDHECLSSHMEVNQYAKQLQETNPNFKIALGNEIYLTNTRDCGQTYYHFILIAKNLHGHIGLRELSTKAWSNVYTDRGMERVPLLKEELSQIMSKYKGDIIATTACIGGELGSELQALILAESVDDRQMIDLHANNINNFLKFCLDIFGNDFYLECAPSSKQDQIQVNRKLKNISEIYNIPLVIGTDAHYLTAEERFVHKAYLNSKDGEREVDDFYEFSRLMSVDETTNLLKLSFDDINYINRIYENSISLQDKIEYYSLERKQMIPKVEVKEYSKHTPIYFSTHPLLNELLRSDNPQERYWINACLESLEEKQLSYNDEYLERLEIEADVIKYIGEKLDDCLFAYFNTFKHYIDLFWECGSTVGPGRGSATGFLSNYLLGITQLDPVRWGLPWWRFLNKERAELPDIDIDLAPSKRPLIFEKIREERGEFGLIQVGTFGTESTKASILTACRGYRSEECPNGIDVDIAQYLSSLVPMERGFLWTVSEMLYGNEEKDRKPVIQFIKEIENYPGLIDIILRIEGIVNKRSSHASGVILYGNNPYETASFMKTPGGDFITCFDLHAAEAAG